MAQAPDGHASEMPEDDAPDIPGGGRHAGGTKFTQIRAHHGGQALGVLEQGVATSLAVLTTDEDGVDDG